MGLLKNVKVINHIIETTAGTSDLSPPAVIDTAGYNGLMFIGIVDTVTAAGTLRMYPMHSDSTSTTDLVSCTGATYVVGSTATTTDMDDKLIVLDIHKPSKRYYGLYVDKATQVSEFRAIAILYDPLKEPVAQSTAQYGVVDSEEVTYPTT